MQITVEIPDDTASKPGGEQAALEAFVVEGLRSGALTKSQGARLMGMGRLEFDGFIKKHQIERFAYSEEDFARDIETFEKLRSKGLFQR